MPLRVPAVLAVAVLASGCKDDCDSHKTCYATPRDAGTSGDAVVCPQDIPAEQPCPPGCDVEINFC